MSEHTELPWRKAVLCGGGRFELLGDRDIYIGEIHMVSSACPGRATSAETAKANAEFIVRACNRDDAFEDLLDACKWIHALISTASDGGNAWCAVRDQPGAKEWANNLDAAIKKAWPDG